ncbi:MAG: GldG family protein [Spirochaetota bacterium]|nr:GldG family protein [Spirochaetota bacterium]
MRGFSVFTLFCLLLIFTGLTGACGMSRENKILESFFDSLYRDKSVDPLLSSMLPFFANDVREKRLPVYGGQGRLSDKIRDCTISGMKEQEKDERLSVSASLREIPRTGAATEKGFIARFAKRHSPDGKDSVWMLYDMAFSAQPVQNTDAWLRLIELSPASRSLLSTLSNDADVLLFGRVSEDPVIHILREIAACIPARIRFSYHDPDIDRGMAASYGISRSPHIVIENGNRRAIIPISDLSWEEQKTANPERVLGAEQKLTAAFLRVAGPSVYAVFIEGMGERNLDRNTPRGLSRFIAALSNSGYIVQRERLGSALDQAAADARQILIFADPRYAPAPDEEAKLLQALGAGTVQALFLFDTPVTPWGMRLAAAFGFRALGVTILDPTNKDSFRGARWIESLIQQHEAALHYVHRPSFRFLIGEGVGSIQIKDFTSDNFRAQPIVSCSSNGWASIDFDPEKPDEAEYEPGKDIPGPLHFGFAVSTAGSKPAAIFIGDADCIANELFQSRMSNWLFTADLLAWLLANEVYAVPAKSYPTARQYR